MPSHPGNPAEAEPPPDPGTPEVADTSANETHGSQQVSGVAPRPRPDFSQTAGTQPSDLTRTALEKLVQALEQIGVGVLNAREADRLLAQHAHELQGLLTQRETDTGDLQRRVQALESQLRSERRQTVSELLLTLEQNDEFLALLIEEHDSELKQARRERDEVLAQVTRVKSGAPPASAQLAPVAHTEFLSEPPTTRRESHLPKRTKTDPGLGDSPASVRAHADEYAEDHPTVRPPAPEPDDQLRLVQQQLAGSHELVDKLLLDKQRSLDLIRRLQTQRDDAHRDLLHLKRELLASAPTASRPVERRPSSSETERPTDPAPAMSASSPPAAPGTLRRWPAERSDTSWDTGGALPAPPPSLTSSLPNGLRPMDAEAYHRHAPPPELSAAVFDSTQPSAASTSASSRPVLRPKPSLAERPLVTYSMVPSDPGTQPGLGEISLKPPRAPRS